MRKLVPSNDVYGTMKYFFIIAKLFCVLPFSVDENDVQMSLYDRLMLLVLVGTEGYMFKKHTFDKEEMRYANSGSVIFDYGLSTICTVSIFFTMLSVFNNICNRKKIWKIVKIIHEFDNLVCIKIYERPVKWIMCFFRDRMG